MSDRRFRPSQRALVPDDVTDPLLWRLAVDVITAHQLGPNNRCVNPQCSSQVGPCMAARLAQRAMRVARAKVPEPRHLTSRTATDAGTRANQDRDRNGFVGWFTSTAAHLRWRIPQRLPRRIPGAALAAA